ncbi:MAG: DUF3459 domain-containing protein, partial [Anaerolineae bacterium]|nr:DUF3459 domain-containing protein [Anaerolineae bacterium]
MPFNFGLVNRPWDARGYREIVDGVEAALAKLPPGAWPNYVLGNHDEPRIASRVGPKRARAAMMLLLTLRGTPTVYYGDEIGMTNVPIPPEKEQDPFGKRVKGENIGRDPERTPMQWDASPNAGFTAPDVEPWLPVADDFQTVNVAAQDGDPRSTLTFTRRLLAMRREFAALCLGRYRPVEGTPPSVFAYERAHGDDRYLIAVNFGGDDATVQLDGDGRGASGQVLLSTAMDREGDEGLASFRLRGNEGCVIALR